MTADLTPPTYSAAGLITRLGRAGVRLWTRDSKLHFVASGNPLSAEDKLEISCLRGEVIDELRREGCDFAAYPVSEGQEELWYAHEAASRMSIAHNLLAAVQLRDGIEQQALETALYRVIERHETLRASYHHQFGSVWQSVAERAERNLTVCDLFDPAPQYLIAAIEQFGATPFDLSSGAPWRAALLQHHSLGHVTRVLVFCAHHIALDFQSLHQLLNEWAEFASGHSRADLPGRPRDGVAGRVSPETKRLMQDRARSASVAFWAGAPSDLVFPLPRAAVDDSKPIFRDLEWTLSAPERDALLRFSKESNVTLFGASLSFLSIALGRLMGQSKFAMTLATATVERTGGTETLGNFANLVPVCVRLEAGQDVAKVAREVFVASQSALQFRDVAFSLVTEAIRQQRPGHGVPIAGVTFAWHREPDLAASPRTLDFGSVLPLSRQLGAPGALLVTATTGRDRVAFRLTYNSNEVQSEYALAVAKRLEHLTRSASGLTAISWQAIRFEPEAWEPALKAPPERLVAPSVLRMIQDAAKRRPNAIAVATEEGELSYRELFYQAGLFAAGYRSRGVGRGDAVAVYMKRDLGLLPAILGIWIERATYVPIDADYPAERVDQIIALSSARCIVTSSDSTLVGPDVTRWNPATDEAVGDGESVAAGECLDSEIAYIIFTSGSTGEPKGVAISQRSLSHFIASFKETVGLDDATRYLAVSSISFDASIAELFAPLAAGARLRLGKEGIARDPDALLRVIRSDGTNAVQATATCWAMLMAVKPSGRWPVHAHSMGESLPAPLATRMREEFLSAWNLYGPTEATVYVAAAQIAPIVSDELTSAAIAAPLPGCDLWVLDECRQPLETGIIGELWIAGPHVATCYWGNPNATAEAFQLLPHLDGAGGRFYRTGDLARRIDRDRIEILGRRDQQVKIAGFRVELGEIEAQLMRSPGVTAAGATVATRSGARQIHAYVCAPEIVDIAAITNRLRQSLPAYMVPNRITQVDALPLNPSGKLDRLKLRAIDIPDAPATQGSPASPQVARLKTLLEKVLNRAVYDSSTSFFDLGADSLRAVELKVAIESSYGRSVPMRAIYDHPTLVSLAAYLDGAERAGEGFENDLAVPVRFSPPNLQPITSPQRILLTGGTGYLGTRLIRDLLHALPCEIVCLVRSGPSESPRARLLAALNHHGIELPEDALIRITAISGVLGTPQLGLSIESYEELAATTDAVLHCAALVNFALPYESLRGNVRGTSDLIEFCGLRKAKKLHFISTYSVLDPNADEVGENFPPSTHDYLSFGYARSKWVCEHKLHQASALGLRCSIYRPSRIVSGKVGVPLNTSDFYSLVVAGSLAAGVAPYDSGFDNFVDVDAVSQQIAAGVVKNTEGCDATNLCAVHWTPWSDVLDALRGNGADLRPVSYETWLQRIESHARDVASLRGIREIREFLHGDADKLRRCLLNRYPKISALPTGSRCSLGVAFEAKLLADHVAQLSNAFDLQSSA